MIFGNYCFADTVFCFQTIYETVHRLCAAYRCADKAEYTISISPEDIDFERSAVQAEPPTNGAIHHAPDDYLETLAVYRKMAKLLPEKNTLLFHGSAIAVDGKCYLFTAKSGTGKSTHTRLWRQMLGKRAWMVNDDKPLLRVENGKVTVFGTPWDGKHHLSTNTSVPLAALCILERSQTNRIVPITPRDALPMLIQQAYRPEDPQAMLKTLFLLDNLSKSVGLYRLGCNMEPEAAQVAFSAMCEKRLADIDYFEETV